MLLPHRGFYYEVLDPVTRTRRIRAVIDNRDGALKPKMYANAHIRIELGDRLAVDDEALFERRIR